MAPTGPKFESEANHAHWAVRLADAAEHPAVVRGARLSTKGVCEEIVKPATRRGLCSVVELLAAQGPAGNGGGVGTATGFVSHAWKYVVGMRICRCNNGVAFWY